MNTQELKVKTVDDIPEVEPAKDDKEKDEKKSSFKSMFVMAAVAVGAILLLKKFKGKFPNKGDDPMMAP